MTNYKHESSFCVLLATLLLIGQKWKLVKLVSVSQIFWGFCQRFKVLCKENRKEMTANGEAYDDLLYSTSLSLPFGSYSIIFFGITRCIFCHVWSLWIKTGQTGLLEYKYHEIFVLCPQQSTRLSCTLLRAVE